MFGERAPDAMTPRHLGSGERRAVQDRLGEVGVASVDAGEIGVGEDDARKVGLEERRLG